MKKVFIALIGTVTAAFSIISCGAPATQQPTAEITKDSLIARGKYLVTIMGCNDCHTPFKMGPKGPERDMDRMLSGHPAQMPIAKFDTSTSKNWVLFNMTNTAIAGPWGISFAANLTSDETGIGKWTEEQFKKALREGKFKGLDGTRPIMPPMPWENYVNMNDEDLKAIFYFLQSTKPVNNVVPDYISPDKLKPYIN